jgi:Tfp pilus assembly protein PilE
MILIKLFVIIVIVSLNPGCTENSYIQKSFESDQTEVITTLQLIWAHEDWYYHENGEYFACADNEELNNLWNSPNPYEFSYSYSISVIGDRYIATGVKNLDDDEVFDTWTINEDRLVVCIIDDVTIM